MRQKLFLFAAAAVDAIYLNPDQISRELKLFDIRVLREGSRDKSEGHYV